MKEFIRKHDDRIHGVLSCFDRMLFRGYLPIMSGWAMAQFLNALDLKGSRLKPLLLENSERVKDCAVGMAKKHGRPFQYLSSHIRKEDTARQLAERDGMRFADRFASLNWPAILNHYAKRVNPQMRDILHDRPYYWVTAQSEYSTDILFKRRQDLCELYPQLLSHSTLCFGAREVMNFLGRKLHGKFEGEIVSDLSSLVCRRTGGSRIKHRVKENWLKMYDKSGLVLRIETVINNPEEFRVRKQVSRKGKRQTEWVAMRKGVAYLFRYREVSLQANCRYLDALAVADDPTNAKRDLDRVTTPKKDAAGRGCSGFNPLACHDAELFQSIMAGEHCLRGFTNRDIRARLAPTGHLRTCGHDPIKESAKVSRTFRRFHAHALIAKIPRRRRWRVALYGRRVMGTSLSLRDHDFPKAYSKIAA